MDSIISSNIEIFLLNIGDKLEIDGETSFRIFVFFDVKADPRHNDYFFFLTYTTTYFASKVCNYS